MADSDGGYDELWEFLTKHTGLEIELGYQNEDRPDLPYGMLHKLSERPLIGVEARTFSPIDGATEKPFLETPHRPWEWVWQFTIYGEGGAAKMRNVHLALSIPQYHVELLPFRIGETSGIRNIPEAVDGGTMFESRTQIDITLCARLSDGMAVDMAETALVTTNT